MNQVIYTSPYVPAEWIVAYDLSPNRILIGSKGNIPTDSSGGACPFVSRFVQETGQMDKSSLFVFTTECDQMRRGSENLEEEQRQRTFLMNIPTTWNTPESIELYLTELKRLGQFLERNGGVPPSKHKLTKAMREFEMPEDLQKKYGFAPVTGEVKRKIFGENLAQLLGIDTKRKVK